MAIRALRGMVNGAMTEFSSAVSGNRPTAAAPVQSGTAASREHAMAANRDYISQPRLSECVEDCSDRQMKQGPHMILFVSNGSGGGHLSLNISCQTAARCHDC
ncbi:hypothetical protein CHARACLAT_022392 [Characodon lateralis]|uniref:Uncharacterized protein n=1 Tax=Characodon lateralis TaxID=208331 RepID=A0ABU7F563_9TELE|nr:hypothetical protein [Characodon lateralis]